MKKIFSIFAAVLFAGSMMAQVIDVATAIETGNALADDNTTTEADYTIKGVVVNPGYFSLRYKNQTVTIGDDVADANLLTLYQSAGVEAGDTVRVLAGDTVQVVGKIKKYVKSGKTTIEVEKVQIAILAKAAGDRTVDYTVQTGKTLDEILAIGEALPDNGVSPLQYEVVGVVTSVLTSDADYQQYHNQNFWIAEDVDGGTAFQVYRGIGRLNKVNTAVAVGDKVKFVCQIKNYKGKNGNVIENADSNGYVDITEQAQGIENVTLTEKAKKVVVDGNVYIIRNNKMYDLTGAQVR